MAGANDFEALHLDRLTRRFHAHTALDGLNLTVRRGEFIALLGPSGCGKSTALNCIAGLLQLSSGEIRLDDRRIDTLPPEERGFGMVFQNYALFPHMTVRRNIGFGLLMRGLPKATIRAEVEQALALVQLQAFAVFPSAVLVGAPSGQTYVISIAAYEAAFEQFDASLGSTIALIMGLVQLAVVGAVLGLRSLAYRGPAGGGKG